MEVGDWTRLATGQRAKITGTSAKDSCKNLSRILCNDFRKDSGWERTSINLNITSLLRKSLHKFGNFLFSFLNKLLKKEKNSYS